MCLCSCVYGLRMLSDTVRALIRIIFFFLMIRRPPRSTLDRSSAASDVYKRQRQHDGGRIGSLDRRERGQARARDRRGGLIEDRIPVSYTHLRAHETVLDLVCRLLLEKKKKNTCDETSSL